MADVMPYRGARPCPQQIRMILRAARRKKLKARTSPGLPAAALARRPREGQADLICEQGRYSWWT